MKKYFYPIILSMIIFGCSKNITDTAPITEKFVFPVQPGTSEWAALNSVEKMYNACQIPDDILKRLTTKALAETCLEHPLFFNYNAYNDFLIGIGTLINNFNGLSELSKRKGGSSEFLKIYESMTIPNKQNWTSSSTDYTAHIQYLELLMSTDNFFNKFSNIELAKLKTLVRVKISERISNPEYYSLFSYFAALHLYARILKAQNDSLYVNNKQIIDMVSQNCSVASSNQYLSLANLIK